MSNPVAVPGSDCTAVVSGTALGTSGWVASTDTRAKGHDLPANAIDGDLFTRFSSDEGQGPGENYRVRLGSAQRFDELEMEVPGFPGDYARDYDVEVSANGPAGRPSRVVSAPRRPRS